ncbi:MAG: cardiolipin synthase [Gemmataceae bacterium]|nr:cardiolipin synthase [Gemmataceae bacterium]
MDWLDLNEFLAWLPYLAAVLNVLLTSATMAWVLMTKHDSTSAVAWGLVIVFLPFLGAILFFFFGYQHINRPLKRKRRHKLSYTVIHPRPLSQDSGELVTPRDPHGTESGGWGRRSLAARMAWLADRFGAQPLTRGNSVDFYHEGRPAFDAMLQAIRSARHHVHLETFIFRTDQTGGAFLEALAARARDGVKVRLLYDAMGSHNLWQSTLRALRDAGGKSSLFLPVNPFRRRFQVNMRNHRKILVVDGDVGFVGGLNIGDEYLGKSPRFGFWRDTHMRLRGPVVADLQRVFAEDWNFASGERLVEQGGKDTDRDYYHPREAGGPYLAQLIDSGPDRELKGIREIYFAAILNARRRVWIASPYFIPDAGLRDALRLAGQTGVDVRLLGQYRPDKWLPQYAAQYYWNEMLHAGVKVYQYTKGMMHAKVVLVDDEWASVGTANLDNRSLHLNFEVNCLLYSAQAVAELERAYLHDLTTAIRLDRGVFARRPFAVRLLENACRLLSPVL